MTFLKLANVSWVALVGAMAMSTSSACSNNPGPPPQAFVYGVIGPGTESGVDDASACGQGDIQWTLGNAVSPRPNTYADGSNQQGGGVHVTCSVDQDGNGYSIQLAAELDGLQQNGTLYVSGHVNASGSTSGLSGSFTSKGQNFTDRNCTFTQVYNGNPLPAGGAPATGRIWGHLDCPNAQDIGQQGLGGDGGTITRTCDATADFLFENCN
jgi:hypothetical protein